MIESKPELYSESYKKHKENAFLTLIGFYKGYYFMFVMSTFFYIIKHSPTWIFPIVTANIINALTGGKASIGTLIFINGTVLALLLLMNFPMNYLHMHFRATAVRNAEAGLRSALIRKIQRISIPRQRELESGRLQNKIIRDVEAIETLSYQLFTSLLNIIINVIVALAVTVMKSRIVFIFFIVMVPVAGFLVYLFKQPIKKRNRAFREKMEDTAARVSEMVELVPVTRAHALENEEINKMDKLVNLIAEQGYRLDMIQTNFGAVSWIIFQLFQLLCLIFSAYLALNHYIGSGDVVLYQSYFTTIVSQVTSLLTLLPTISKGLESVTSIGEVLCIEEVEDYSNKKEVKELSGEFDFQNVSYNYPKQETEVIHNLTLHINPGETVAFVGESGAGKSTIMNMLVGFCIPTEGKILVDGDDMQELNLHSYREYLADRKSVV